MRVLLSKDAIQHRMTRASEKPRVSAIMILGGNRMEFLLLESYESTTVNWPNRLGHSELSFRRAHGLCALGRVYNLPCTSRSSLITPPHQEFDKRNVQGWHGEWFFQTKKRRTGPMVSDLRDLVNRKNWVMKNASHTALHLTK